MPSLTEQCWIRRTRRLTQALLISGTLNISFMATFVYFVLIEKQKKFYVERAPLSRDTLSFITNSAILQKYAFLSMQDLFLHLENEELAEEGLKRRDLALACLVAFHHFHLDKALGFEPLQKRVIRLNNEQEEQAIDIPVFVGLTEPQFQAILHFAKTEKWPLTTQGQFFELKRNLQIQDPALVETFYLSSEFHKVHSLLTKTGIPMKKEEVLSLILEGDWQTLLELAETKENSLDLNLDQRRFFLTHLLEKRSSCAATLLLQYDLEFALKRLDDEKIALLLDLYPKQDTIFQQFAKGLITSPRTDPIWQSAAFYLYSMANEEMPLNHYDHKIVLQRFAPKEEYLEAKILAEAKPVLVQTTPQKRIHVVVPGDNLWKIARRYQVKIDEIMKINSLDTEKLRPGKELEIPDPKSS